MRERQQNSTTHPLSFLMVSSSDHLTGVTGITPTVTISKDGGAFAASSGAVTELANGWYSLAGNATDRNTLGAFLLHATGTGCDPMDRDYTIVGYDPFNGVNLGITAVPNAVAAASGGLPTVGTSTGQINPDGTGKVSLAAASIDIPTFTPAAWEVLTRRIVATGTTSPVTADVYKIGGFDSNNNIYYVSTTLGTPQYMWNNGAGWTISGTLLTAGSAYFATGSTANVLGPYSAQGTATGTPAVVFKGGAMLDALQLAGPVNASVASYATNQDPATLLFAAAIESGETYLQYLRQSRAFAYGDATHNTATGVTTFLRKDATTTSFQITSDANGNPDILHGGNELMFAPGYYPPGYFAVGYFDPGPPVPAVLGSRFWRRFASTTAYAVQTGIPLGSRFSRRFIPQAIYVPGSTVAQTLQEAIYNYWKTAGLNTSICPYYEHKAPPGAAYPYIVLKHIGELYPRETAEDGCVDTFFTIFAASPIGSSNKGAVQAKALGAAMHAAFGSVNDGGNNGGALSWFGGWEYTRVRNGSEPGYKSGFGTGNVRVFTYDINYQFMIQGEP